MDFLLIVLAIGGFVVAIVMLVLASRANRAHAESQERVETLEAMATGSILFAHASAPEPTDLALNEFADEDDLIFGHSVVREMPSAPATEDFAVTAPAPAYPFVMTVPAAAGAGRVQVSFDRAGHRSRR